MTVKEALRKYQSKINTDETELFLSHLLNWPKTKLYTHPNFELTDKVQNHLAEMVKDRIKRVPAAYILGYKYFYGLKFRVNKHVLIPRHETEWLVDKAMELLEGMPKSKVLDLGTGSGAIAISLAKNIKRKQTEVYASDVSASALKLAKQNAKTLNVKVNFVLSDLLSKHKNSFDIIIANLPYVPIVDYKNLRNNLKFEPKLALTDGTNNAVLYEKLIKQIRTSKNKPKYILLEIDPSFQVLLEQFLIEYIPMSQVNFYKDIHGLVRYGMITVK